MWNLDEVIKKEQTAIEDTISSLTNAGLKTLETLGYQIVKKYPGIEEFCFCNGDLWFETTLELKSNFDSKNIHSLYAGRYDLFLDDWLFDVDRSEHDLPPDWVEPFLEDFGKLNEFANFLNENNLF